MVTHPASSLAQDREQFLGRTFYMRASSNIVHSIQTAKTTTTATNTNSLIVEEEMVYLAMQHQLDYAQ